MLYYLFKRGHLGGGQVWAAVTSRLAGTQVAFVPFLKLDHDPPVRPGQSQDGMSVSLLLSARRSSSSHANSTVSDVCVTCPSLPSVRPSYFPPLHCLLEHWEPLEINKRKKKGAVVGTGPAPVSRLSPADGQRGLNTYKLPSVKPKPPVSFWLHWAHIIVNFLNPALHTLSSDKARWVWFYDTHLRKCFTSPKLVWAIVKPYLCGLWLSGAGQLHVACLKWRQPTGGERVVFWGWGLAFFFFFSSARNWLRRLKAIM